jgi:cell division ATPase FtsA
VDEINSPMYATGAGLVVHALNNQPLTKPEPSTYVKPESRTQAAKPATEPVADETPERPTTNFIGKVKSWFESTMSNTGDFIE